MRAGNKVYCIKNRFDLNVIGGTYEILSIDKNADSIIISTEPNTKFKQIEYKLYGIIEGDYSEFWVFDAHFISLKKIRKQKLQKIQNGNR
jgi:hypothetical protein